MTFVAILKSISYYAGIMLNALNGLLCSKLCWHNWLVPSYDVYNYAVEVYYAHDVTVITYVHIHI